MFMSQNRITNLTLKSVALCMRMGGPNPKSLDDDHCRVSHDDYSDHSDHSDYSYFSYDDYLDTCLDSDYSENYDCNELGNRIESFE